MDDERCSEAINILAFVVRVIPVCPVLLVDGIIDEIGERLAGRNSTLRDSDSSIVPACRVEEHAMVMHGCIVVSQAIGLWERQKPP